MKLECIDFRPNPRGCFLGFADFFLPDENIDIFCCTLHKKDSRRWLNLPSRSFEDPYGRPGWQTLVKFHDIKKYREFCEQSKEEIDKFIEKNQNGLQI